MHAIAQLLWPRPRAAPRTTPRTVNEPVAEPRILHDDRLIAPVGDRLPAQDPCLPWWFDQSLA